MSTLPAKPRRRTTKRFVYLNLAASWFTIWWCVAYAPEALQWLATPIVLLIVGIFGFYTGTGTADMFAALRHAKPRAADPYAAHSMPMPLDPMATGGGYDRPA